MNYYYKQKLFGDLVSVLKGMVGFHQTFEKWMEEAGLNITDTQFKKLTQYVDLLKKKNEELNLTSITDPKEVWIKHILDSLITVPFFKIKPGMKVMDVGTGGGLPGIPLAIMFPSVQFVLIDSTQKKITAVEEFVKELGLKNVACIATRAETIAHHPSHRDQYDLVLTRAVAPLRVLIELTVPLIHLYGNAIAYKGPEYISELSQSQNAIIKLKSEPPRVYQYSLPEGMGNRTIIQITKKHVTPDVYPRREGIPNKRPL
ncbi:16S rRNA (guanine(527)-N(7))-methyltransferase RsmG [Patescibacteria group bacterium]|nr:16S rRNA (guanine(527)-N(7))-methyltransferase RsmG [Patescibacteria group bacterium]MBU1682445.1 16S rRNA (guanine(527)-N(7))-methyltransferase RsmG [Patescibacteria group bacterium]MBU1935706.1 16S rRNA (guanine(527)-N(7))-methyltransferase RsmG [Patescibacteria group bacterium]